MQGKVGIGPENLIMVADEEIYIETNVASVTATTNNLTGSNIMMVEDNSLAVNTITAGGGNSHVTLILLDSGAVTDGNGPGVNNVTANNLAITAPSGIDLDTTIQTFEAETFVNNGDVNIRELDDLGLRLVNAGAGNVDISAGNNGINGAIIDMNGINGNVIGNDLVLTALDGIGSGDALETQVSRFQGTNTNNGIEIYNFGGLTLADINTLGYAVSNTNGWIDITAASPLAVDAHVLAGGDIRLVAGDDDSANTDNLAIAANVNIQSTAGNILLQAGDDITQAAGTGIIAAGGGFIDIIAGHDNDDDGMIDIAGTIGSGAEALYVESDEAIVITTNVASLTALTERRRHHHN